MFVWCLCRIGDDKDSLTCQLAQQMGFFHVDDPSQCDKAMAGTGGETTHAQILMYGALMCCKSKVADQSVCKVDKCVLGMSKCLGLHNDFAAIEEKLTDPKAMEKDEKGESYGSCAKAILNSVEGALCCTAGMKQITMCAHKEVGDIDSCKDSWNTAFEADFHDKADAITKSFQPGGYCTAFLTSSSPATSTKTKPLAATATTVSPLTTGTAPCDGIDPEKESCCKLSDKREQAKCLGGITTTATTASPPSGIL